MNWKCSTRRAQRGAGEAGYSGELFGDLSPLPHELKHINDGRYGNGRSWLSNEKEKLGELELPSRRR